MTQSKRQSAIESAANTLVGFVIAYIANYFIMRAFGHPVTVAENFYITILFTLISFARSYVIRRFFARSG